MTKHFAAALAALTLAVPVAAQAQEAPSYAQPQYASADVQISATCFAATTALRQQ